MKNKYQKKKNKNRKYHGLTVIFRTIKNQSKQKIQSRPLWSTTRGRTYRDHLLHIGNLTNDTTEEEILALLALNGTTYLRENSLERMQFTDNGKFAGCIHVRMPRQFIETILELNGLGFKNRNLVIQPLTEMMKLQQSGKRNNYPPYGGLSFRTKQGGKGRGNGYSRGRGQSSTRQKE